MSDEIAQLLADYPVVVETDVAWGDMDAFQHVNNAVYFRWFETARIAYFAEVGFVPEGGGLNGIGPILASTDCRYRIPLTFPDRVSVGARARDLEDDRFVMDYAVVSHRHHAVAATGTGRIVSFDYDAGRKAPVPAQVRQAIERLQG